MLEEFLGNINDEKLKEMLNKPVYVCLLKIDDNYYVMCQKYGTILGFENMNEAINFWDIPYENAFRRGLGAVTGATLLHVNTFPRIVYFKTQKEMIKTIFMKPPFKIIEIQFNYALECQNNVKELYDKGYEIELFKKI